MNKKRDGAGAKIEKTSPLSPGVKGASTILLQYLLLNMFIDLKDNLEEIGAKRICEVSMKKL